MTHLTPDEFMDAAERGELPRARQAHLEHCETCRREVVAIAALLREAAEVPVPEPSPLFWERFSARVRQAVADEGPQATPWSQWGRWPTLVPLAGLALLLVALVATIRTTPAPVAGSTALAAGGSEPAAVDVVLGTEGWDVMAELVGPLDWETADAAGLSLAPGDAEVALLSLSAEEQRELSWLLEGELARSKS